MKTDPIVAEVFHIAVLLLFSPKLSTAVTRDKC